MGLPEVSFGVVISGSTSGAIGESGGHPAGSHSLVPAFGISPALERKPEWTPPDPAPYRNGVGHS
jgi:hypothetical protein